MPRDNAYVKESPLAATEVAVTTVSSTIDLRQSDGVAIVNRVTDSSPATMTFVDADVDTTNNTVTETAHGFVTGMKGALTTDGALPTGLSATNYWIIRNNANTFKFATSAANASAGTAVNITAAEGGGTHTFTPTAMDIDVNLQISVTTDTDTEYVTISTQNFTSTGTITWNVDKPHYLYARIQYSFTAGQATIQTDSAKEYE